MKNNRYLICEFEFIFGRLEIENEMITIEFVRLQGLFLVRQLLDLVHQRLEEHDRLQQQRLVRRRRDLCHQLLKPMFRIAHFLVLKTIAKMSFKPVS